MSTSTPKPQYNTLPPTDDTVKKVTDIICHAFWDAPLLRAFVSELDNIPPNLTKVDPEHPITQSRRVSHFLPGIDRVVKAGATTCESGNFSAVSIWEPPSFDAPDFSSVRKDWVSTSRDWTRQMKLARARYLGTPAQRRRVEDVVAGHGEIDEHTTLDLVPFWHLSFLARNPDPDVEVVKGAVRDVVWPFLERAKREGVPAWLEATTERGVAIYEHWGFRVVARVVVGEDRFGKDGWPVEGGGGEGASAWCMIFDGHLDERKE